MTTQTAATPVEAPRYRRSWLERIVRAREISLVVLIVVVVGVTTAVSQPYLFSSDGWRLLLTQPTVLILVGVGEALVIITRNIDLSVGSVMGLSTYLAGWLFGSVPGIPIPLVVLGAVVLGAICGVVNGLLVAFLKVPSLVITLGTLYAFRGIDVLVVGSNFIRPDWIPLDYQRLGTGEIPGIHIPWLFVAVLVVVLAVGWFMTSRRAGRELYAIGSDPEAAILFGLRVRRMSLTSFVLSGALAGLAGCFYLALYVTGDSQVGTGFELQAVAAAVVGGVAITGGSGTIWGVALGGFLLTTIASALPVLGIPSLWQQAVVGFFIVLAIGLDRALFVARSRRARAERSRA